MKRWLLCRLKSVWEFLLSSLVIKQRCKARQRASDAPFCNFEQKSTVSPCLPCSSPSASLPWLSVCLLSHHHIDSLSLPLSIIRTLLSVSLSCALFLFTLLACFCQTVSHSVSSRQPPLFIPTLALSLFNRHFIIYNHICLWVCTHTPGVRLSWVFLMMISHMQMLAHAHVHRSTSAHAHTHAQTHAHSYTHTHRWCAGVTCDIVQITGHCVLQPRLNSSDTAHSFSVTAFVAL